MADSPTQRSTVILITHDGMGHGDTDLQHALLSKYLGLLLAGNMIPGAMCFYTDGVHLVSEGSPVLDSLRALEQRGCRLLVCSTCLEYLGLRDQVRVGTVCGMPDILNAQIQASKVITI
jgi:hypothetical protein